MNHRTTLCLLLLLAFLAAVPAAGSEEAVLTVGDDKVSVDEVLYLLGLEIGETMPLRHSE